MHVAVLGSGVIGVTTAWYLAQAGHQVTVLDRQPRAAMETSAANAGQISAGYAAPWAAPGIPCKAVEWLFQPHSPLSFRPDGSLFQISWLWKMLRQCDSEHYARNKTHMVRLAEYSVACLQTLRDRIGIDYEGRQQGTLQLFRTEQQYENANNDIKVLETLGIPYQLLTAQQLSLYEPALATAPSALVGGLRLPQDETGDCQLFTQRLAQMAEQQGVTFQFNTKIDRLLSDGAQVKGVQCGENIIKADAYVVALGAYSTALLAQRIAIPVYPLKGYSLTFPLLNETHAPHSTVLDETYKVAITRFEKRIRVGGMAEVVGFNRQLLPSRQATLKKVVNDLFPQAGDLSQAQFWTGLRPMTPDGTPIVGRTSYKDLYLNTGHGTLGWTMACGSAQLLADLLSGKTPEIPYEAYSVQRYLTEQGH